MATNLDEKLRELVYLEEDKSEVIRKILNGESKRYKEINVGGEMVKIRPSFPRPLRHKIQELQELGEDISVLEDKIYELVAEMCLEDPFNNPDTWKLIDEETGIILDIWQHIYQEAFEFDKSVEKFRKK